VLHKKSYIFVAIFKKTLYLCIEKEKFQLEIHFLLTFKTFLL